MKVIVTGAKGQLGYDIVKYMKESGHEVIGMGREDADITDYQAVDARFRQAAGAEAVIHCAAYTAVDAAEEDAETARRVNVEGTENIAKACAELGMKLLYISTEYVFDGMGDEAFHPEDVPAPLNVYGETKLGGERAVMKHLKAYFIVRISWGFGSHGSNFVKTILKLGETRKTVQVVDDQIGSPTYTKDLAPLLARIAASDRYGIYHASNTGYTSRYAFAEEIYRLAGMDVAVMPVKSDAYPVKAIRPKNSRLSHETLLENGFPLLRNWEAALADYLAELGYPS